MSSNWTGTGAYKRLAYMAVICLLATACAGEDADVADTSGATEDTTIVDDAAATDPDTTGDVDGDDSAHEGTEPLDFGEDTNIALIDCVDGDDFSCELAEDYLGGVDGVRELALACDAGDEFACEAFDRIVEVTTGGEDPNVDRPDSTSSSDEEPIESDVLGYVVVRADSVETTTGPIFFGTEPDVVIDEVSIELGPPTDDSGVLATGDGSGCSGSEYRFVSWGDTLTLTMLDESEFGSGFLHVSAWQHDGGEGVFVEAFVGDATTVDIDPGFTTVAELEATLGTDVVDVYDEPPIGPTYEVNDNLGLIFGELTDIGPDGIVQTAFAGTGCGE